MASKKQKRRKDKGRRHDPPRPLDRRLRSARVTADAPGVRVGDMLVGLSVAETPRLGEVWFYETLVPYMLLVDVRLEERRAFQALRRARQSAERRDNGKLGLRDSGAVVEAQRLGTRACILAMAALEAFCAEVLPEDASYTRTKGKDAPRTFDRDGIYGLRVPERFGDALPEVLGKESIKRDQQLWLAFKRIVALRNAAIHPTHQHLHSARGELDPERLSARIMAEEFIGAAAMAEEVMERYAPGYVKDMDAR